jgi:hypothetical protein
VQVIDVVWREAVGGDDIAVALVLGDLVRGEGRPRINSVIDSYIYQRGITRACSMDRPVSRG